MLKSNYCETLKKKPFIEHIFDIIRTDGQSLYTIVGTTLNEIKSLKMFADNLYSNLIILREITTGIRKIYVQILKYEHGNLIFIDNGHYMTASGLNLFDLIDMNVSRKFYGYKKITNELYFEPVLNQKSLTGGYTIEEFSLMLSPPPTPIISKPAFNSKK
jgi:hypothetical protein